MKKRLMSILLAVLMIIAVYPGCGNASSGQGSNASSAFDGDDVVEIRIYHSTFNIASADNLVSENAVYDLSELLPGTDLYSAAEQS